MKRISSWVRRCPIIWHFILLSRLPSVFCEGSLDTPIGEVVVYATDSRIQYSPPLDDSSGSWNPLYFPNLDRNASQTMDPNAQVTLTFQGTSLKLYAIRTSGFSHLDVKLDGVLTSAGDTRYDKKILVIPLGGPEVDSSVNHTVVVRKSAGSGSDASWNILAFGFTAPSPSPVSQLPDVSLTAGVSTSSEVERQPTALTSGAIAGIVIAVLCGIGFASGMVFCLRRRKSMTVDVIPDPLMIESPGHSRSRFRRLYSNPLPHYIAPTSVWPSSVERSTVRDQPAPSLSHGRQQDRILPPVSPLVVKPSPPRRRQRGISHFFIANPSSHSSRSIRSQSLKDSRVLSDRVPANGGGLDLLASDKKMEDGLLEGEERDLRMDKGKGRAVGFEIDPAPPERPRMARKQSLRRFFFTTNPNPSTSSGSSTSSLKRSATAKTAAVADYVRDQIRRHKKLQSGPSQLPTSTGNLTELPVTIPEKVSPADTLDVPGHAIVSQKPRKCRTSQTRFFTTNPSPSIPDSNAEVESVISEIPPPRKDKGKARAF